MPSLHSRSGAACNELGRLIQGPALPEWCALAQFRMRRSLNRMPSLHSRSGDRRQSVGAAVRCRQKRAKDKLCVMRRRKSWKTPQIAAPILTACRFFRLFLAPSATSNRKETLASRSWTLSQVPPLQRVDKLSLSPDEVRNHDTKQCNCTCDDCDYPCAPRVGATMFPLKNGRHLIVSNTSWETTRP